MLVQLTPCVYRVTELAEHHDKPQYKSWASNTVQQIIDFLKILTLKTSVIMKHFGKL